MSAKKPTTERHLPLQPPTDPTTVDDGQANANALPVPVPKVGSSLASAIAKTFAGDKKTQTSGANDGTLTAAKHYNQR